MRSPRNHGHLPVPTLLVGLACLALGGGGGLAVACARADTASPSPSPSATVTTSPSPSPSPTLTPASPHLVAWATHWAKIAKGDRRRVDRLRSCLGCRAVRPLPVQPHRSAERSVWAAYGCACRGLARYWHARSGLYLRLILHPKGDRVARWRPLLLYARWPKRIVPYALVIMNRESSGNPNEVSPTDDWGLMQINACHHVRNVLNPLVNLRYAWYLLRCVRRWYPTWTTARDAPAWAEP